MLSVCAGPDYQLTAQELKKLFPNTPIMVATATATPNVQEDIVRSFSLRNPLRLCQSFNRPNLFYEVRSKDRAMLGRIAEEIKTDFPGETGILYCFSKGDAEEAAKDLREKYGIDAKHFHASYVPPFERCLPNAPNVGSLRLTRKIFKRSG